MSKRKIAFYWCASCGGCEEAVIDIAENLLDVAEKFDIVFWPIAMDFKRKDVEAVPDGEIAASFISGAIRTSEQQEMAELLRRKSQIIIAFGSCAHIGGVPGLANFFSREEILERKYKSMPTVVNPDGIHPQEVTKLNGEELTLPYFFDTVKTLDQTIEVDYYLPGCAPPPDLIIGAIESIAKEELPAKGSVLAPSRSLCDTCPRADSKPDKLSIKEIKRPHEVIIDPEKCFLAQGIICLGPATRSGCGERCINANMPCRGCFGPVAGVKDQGAKILTAIASILGVENEEQMEEDEVKKLIDQIVDPAGIFYFYSLPASTLRRKRVK